MMRTTLLLALLAFVHPLSAENIESLKSHPPGGPVPVSVTVVVLDIREIDGARQSFAGDIFIKQQWKDARLANQGRRTMVLSDVWNPVLQMGNRIAVQTSFPESLEIDNDGNVVYRQRFIGTFACRMDLAEFPFDRQKLRLRLAVAGMAPQEVKFLRDPESTMGNQLSITDWHVTGWKAWEEPFQIVPGSRTVAGYVFEFDAKRYFYYFLVQIVFPLTLILGMSFIVFWIDRTQVGPRISISITTMLTTIAYRLMIGNFLPRLPYLTRLDYFVFGSTVLVFFALVVVVAVAKLTVQKNETAAARLDFHSRWFFPALFVSLICGAFFL